MLRRSILVLLVMWLPLQALAAVAMPFCAHALGGGTPVVMDHQGRDHGAQHAHAAHGAHDPHAAHAAGATPDDERPAAPLLDCDACQLCHIACSVVLPASAAVSAAPGPEVFVPAPGELHRSIQVAPFDRPPMPA